MSDILSQRSARFDYDPTKIEEITARIREGVRLALLDHKRKGNPIVGCVNGEIVWTEAEDIVIPDEGESDTTTR